MLARVREGEQPKPPLGERPWFIALMMFAFFPVGLVLFWRSEIWGWGTKWAVTISVVATVIWAVGRLEA